MAKEHPEAVAIGGPINGQKTPASETFIRVPDVRPSLVEVTGPGEAASSVPFTPLLYVLQRWKMEDREFLFHVLEGMPEREIQSRALQVIAGQEPDEFDYIHVIYHCGQCGRFGVRLWRPYGNFYRSADNRCRKCVPKVGYVPCVLSPSGDPWGHTSVPEEDRDQWYELPE